MNLRRPVHLAAVAIAALAVLVMATPASAAPFIPYNGVMIRGRVSVGALTIDTPSPGACPGSTTLFGTAEVADPPPVGIDNMDGTLNMATPSFALGGGSFQMVATGATGAGINRGNYDFVTNTFNSLAFPTVAWSVRPINLATCAVGAIVCSGTANTSISGTIAGGVPMPPGGPATVNGAGVILTRGACAFPVSLVFTVGSVFNLTANPAFPLDTGAVFV